MLSKEIIDFGYKNDIINYSMDVGKLMIDIDDRQFEVPLNKLSGWDSVLGVTKEIIKKEFSQNYFESLMDKALEGKKEKPSEEWIVDKADKNINNAINKLKDIWNDIGYAHAWNKKRTNDIKNMLQSYSVSLMDMADECKKQQNENLGYIEITDEINDRYYDNILKDRDTVEKYIYENMTKKCSKEYLEVLTDMPNILYNMLEHSAKLGICIKSNMTAMQSELCLAGEHGLYDMNEAQKGFSDGLTFSEVSAYYNENFDSVTMENIRERLEEKAKHKTVEKFATAKDDTLNNKEEKNIDEHIDHINLDEKEL